MKYIAAYLLARLGGNENPTKEDIEKIIESVGIECEQEHAEEIIEKLKGKNIDEVIKDGQSKLSVVSNENSSQTNQSQISNENDADKENEEEVMDIEGGFDDLFQ